MKLFLTSNAVNVLDKIYIGSSAGSIIVGPNLEPIRDFDDPSKADLENYEGFGLVDFVIMPHWGREKYIIRQEKALKEFGSKYKLKTITDEEMVII
ncbi:MAG: putative peptidase, dipeptidase [Candidatus Berkelbacteria bacterium]|nr:putative peptidase, dipeptidase [Candidatus Berkelbacteria bacterium]